MKTLSLILALTFTVMFPSPSFAGWKWVSENVKGSTYYVDFERIRKHDGYVYWWDLIDLLQPDKEGDLSSKSYYQGDCMLFRYKYLSISFHKEPMGGGTGNTSTYNDDDWRYPPPDTGIELKLKQVCSR